MKEYALKVNHMLTNRDMCNHLVEERQVVAVQANVFVVCRGCGAMEEVKRG